jgi:hypothetical protein
MTEAHVGDEAWVSEWGDATATAIERDIVRYGAVPDLADVLARARAMDPEAVPDAWDDLVDDEGGIVGLAQARALQRDVPDAGVGGFASALRAEIEVGLHERSMSAIPIAPQPRRRWPIAVAAVSLAAAVVLWMAGPRILAQLDASSSPSTAEAVQSASPDREAEQWHERVPEPPSPPVVTPAEEPEIEAEDATSTGAVEVDTDDTARATPRRTRPTLEQLEAEALAAWRAGDLASAERRMHAIARSGRTSRAELAYGDLFSLARQRRGAAGQVAMWREYLRRFPRGRFADDARGGLCRRAEDADSARSCWTDYLRHHPSGTYATEASRWTSAPQ